ncbi:hypothetical protein JCM11491_005923 [Sporobolomyces phaffii]
MTSYGTSGAFESHWQTPPPDSTTATFFDQTSSSYDSELLDVFHSDPFQPYDTSRGHDVSGMDNQRIASGNDGSMSSYSDAASSPQGSLSYASSTGYSTGNTSFGVGGPGSGMDFDLNSLFNGSSGGGSTNGDSPPFDFGNSLSCEFDTSGLQGLFSQQQLPLLQPHFQQPYQGLSPSSTMSANSPPHAYPLSHNYHFQQPAQQNLAAYPPQYLAPGQGPPATYPTPARNPSISSAASPSSMASTSLVESETSAKRRRVTLAETAGLAPHQHHSSSIAPAAFTVKADVPPQLTGDPHAQSHGVQSAGVSRKPKAKSPAELIVNAGMSNAGVYNAPTYQLLPKPVNIATSNNGAKGKRGVSSILPASSVSDDKSAGGGKRKKPAERGHNAVEQKYRNSINNALATLRDTIPALRHLKPLASMPVSKRKASQFTLPSNVGTSVPSGLVDGVQAAKTLSKGVILNKAIEYIDYLRFSRESQNEDLETLKEMVRTMVGGGEQLVAEFEQKQQERDSERTKEREMEREDGDGDDDDEGEGEGDEEEDERPAPSVSKTKKAAAAPKKRGAAKKDTSPSVKGKSMASIDQDSTMTLPSQQISPPLSSEYHHVQALNAAHLESIAASSQAGPVTHTFPPSPVSSDDHSVSPAALVVDPSQYQSYGAQPPRVLLASFMGLSFAGGVGYDWTSGAAAAASEASEVVGSAWTSRLARRSLVSASEGALVDLLHPSLLSGLVTLGIASFFVSLVYIVQPLLRSKGPAQRPDALRIKALSALAASAASASDKPPTFSNAKAHALAARTELLALVHGPTTISLLPGIVKETCKWILSSRIGLSWASPNASAHSEDQVEQAIAWVRIAEIETTVGFEISTLSRLYTFLRLLNLSRSSAWPQVTASTSVPAVTALLSTHLLSSGHVRWAEGLWQSIASLRKKGDASDLASDSFVEVALDADFETVKSLLDPSVAYDKSDVDMASPKDTVPLLLIAEATCVDALQDVWTRIFTSIVDSTCPPHQVDAVPSKEKLQTLLKDGELEDTLELVFKASVEGSEVRSLTLMTRAILDTFSDTKEGKPHAVARVCMSALLSEARQGGPFARFASSSPLCRLLLPSLPTDLVASFPPVDAAVNSVDHLAATTLSWLLLRRESLDLLSEHSAYPSPPPSPTSSSSTFDKVDLKTHARALSLRRLLAHDAFRTVAEVATRPAAADEAIDFDDAKELLVDALTGLARRAAGLRSRDEDSGVEL